MFTVLETIVRVLEPVSFLTDALSGEKEVTISAIGPIIRHIQKDMTASSDDSNLAKQMKKVLIEDLMKRNTSARVKMVMDISTFLDPRFKDCHFEEGSSRENIISSVTEECILLLDTSDNISGKAISLEESCETDDVPPAKKAKGLAAIMSKIITEQVTDTGPSITPTQKVENELAFYLDFPMVSIDQNPLESWKTEQGRFPILAQLAKKYLCVCGGTSVPSERIFSKAGYINDHLRSRLLPKNVDKLVFLPKNIV